MDRCALFVDAGYVLADGAMAVHGTRRRESVSWDYPGLLQLLTGLAAERSNLPLLRCYWYDATVEGRRSAEHEALADLPGVKLRVVKMRPGRREGVESEIHRDLTTLARNKAVTDAVVVSAEEDLGQVISDVQDMGLRVTLLHVADADAEAAVSRSLLQECDDIAEIRAAHLQPYVELVSGAEPPRPDERDGAALPLRSNGNGNGYGPGPSDGRAAAYAQQAPVIPDARQQVPAVPVPPPAAAAGYVVPESDVPETNSPAAYQQRFGQDQQPAQPRMPAADQQNGGRAVTEYGVAPEYGVPGDGGAADRRYVPDYGNFPGYGPGPADFAQAPADAPPARQEQAAPRQEQAPSRQEQAQPGRQEFPARAELAARDEPYGAPAAVPVPADELPAERQQARIRQDGDPSGYSPGAVREQFREDPQSAPGRELPANDADRYQPVPVGTSQVTRLPTRGAPVAGPAGGQPVMPQPPAMQPSVAQPSVVQSAPGQVTPGQSAPPAPAEPVNGQQSGPHLVASVVPMAPAGVGYSGGRLSEPAVAGTGQQGGLPAGGQPLPSPVAPVVPVTPAAAAPPVAPGRPHGPAALLDTGYQASQSDSGAPAVYSGGQSGVSLGDAVQSAHEEGLQFGDSVARDAPALWLEAVLARKPRMPSDLEARLLQGSALPIDFLLHDEVRHALRRGFWDAMERTRR